MPPKKDNKPKGAMTSYAAFVQLCREEHRKKHPDDSIHFSEFSKKCSDRWKKMTPKEKERFEDIAKKDKARYLREMASYVPADGGATKRKRKDPKAPKRALSAFFFFCGEYRSKVKEEHPSYSIGDVAKELGKRWEKIGDKTKYELLAAEDKLRYAKAMEEYNAGDGAALKSNAQPPKKSKVTKQAPPESEDEDDSEVEDDDDESDD